MASTTLPKRFPKWVLVVDEQELRRLADECRKALTSEVRDPDSIDIRLTARLRDGAIQEHLSLDDFLAIENERGRAIIGAELQAEAAEASIICRFATEKSHESSVTVVGQDRQWVYATVSRLEERFRNMKEWYPRGIAWLAGLVFTGFAAIGVLYLLQLRGVVFETVRRGDTTDFNTAGRIAFLVSVCAMVVGAICARVLLPNVVFHIGYGKRRADMRRDVRVRIGWTVGVGLIMGLVLAGLQRLIWPPS